MGWTGFPVQEGDDWTSTAFVNQFIRATNERLLATGLTNELINEVQAGDDIQDAAFWRNLQHLAASSYYNTQNGFKFGIFNPADQPIFSFWPTGVFNIFHAEDKYVGQQDFTSKHWRYIKSFNEPGQLGQRARLSHDPRPYYFMNLDPRVYEHNGTQWVVSDDQQVPADIITRHVVMQPGDFFGPWIFNELHDAINACRYSTASTVDPEAYASKHSLPPFNWTEPTLSAAHAHAMSTYGVDAGGGNAIRLLTHRQVGASQYYAFAESCGLKSPTPTPLVVPGVATTLHMSVFVTGTGGLPFHDFGDGFAPGLVEIYSGPPITQPIEIMTLDAPTQWPPTGMGGSWSESWGYQLEMSYLNACFEWDFEYQ